MAYRLISLLLALVLLMAAGLKLYALRAGTAGADGTLNSTAVQLAVSIVELALGVWLLSGWFPKSAHRAAVTGFFCFFAVAAYEAARGSASCGCFGYARVSPWVMIVFDAAALLALTVSVPAARANDRLGRPKALGAAAASLFVGLGIGGAGWLLGASWDGAGGAATAGIPNPVLWTGTQLPLADHTDLGPRLNDGPWIIVLYRGDCSECRAAIPRYLGLAHAMAGRPGVPRMALVELPPYPMPGQAKTVGAGESYARGRLKDLVEWDHGAPWFIAAEDGLVTKVTRSPDAILSAYLVGVGESDSAATSSRDGLLFPRYVEERRNLFLREIACGPLALVAVLQHLAVALSPSDVDSLLALAGSKGVDLLQLKQAAERYGLHTLGVSVSTRQLRAMNEPAVVYLEGIGFAAVTGYDPDGLRTVYPLQPPGIVPDDLFERSFGKEGVALLISRSPLSPSRLGLKPPADGEGASTTAAMQAEKSIIAVGRINRHTWESTLTVTNTGSAPVALKEVRTNCPCVTATLDTRRLDPGASAVLRAKGQEKDLGGFHRLVYVEAEQSDGLRLTIPVRGYVEQPVGFDVPARMLRGVRPGEAASVEVPVDLSAGVGLDQVEVEVPKGAPLTAAFEAPAAGPPVLRIRWLGSPSVGWHRFGLPCRLKNHSDSVVSVFQVAVEVVPWVEVFPLSLYVRSEENLTGWTRDLTCVFRGSFDGRYAVEWADQDLARFFRIEPVKIEGKTAVFRLSPNSDLSRDKIRGRTAGFQIRAGDHQSPRVTIGFEDPGSPKGR